MYKLQYKHNGIGTIKEFATLEECKWWFEMVCNIPWNWNVITPSGRTLDGKYYQTW